ncbi:MAG: hypothetical protein ACU84J_05175 [Gammaproteobacteria bacterium]
MKDILHQLVDLKGDEKDLIVEKKATCPFIGSAVAQGELQVRNNAKMPLAAIEEVRTLGNSGGGDLGDLLVLFAAGNHGKMPGDSGKLDRALPDGLFSLDFPGSQGSHPGHSGILQDDPERPDSGRFSDGDFARLINRAKDGWLKRSDVGAFIAENLHKDPKSKVFMPTTFALLGLDLAALVKTAGSALLTKFLDFGQGDETTHRDIEQKLTKLTGEDNLVGSAGEFGLIFAFLVNKPDTEEIGGEPAIAVQDLQSMFVDKRLPEGWKSWKKTRIDWVKNTTALVIVAGKEYLALK